MSQKHNYLKSASIVGMSTLASRILGMVRDMAMASLFGAGMVLDAFVLAFTIPNLFRRFLGEGAFSAAFLPVFTEILEKEGKEKAKNLAKQTGTFLFAILLILVLVGILVCLLALLWDDIGDKNRIALKLSAIMMPFLLLVCWAAFAGAMLNSMQHFWSPAFAPALLNFIWIAGIFLIIPLCQKDHETWAYIMAISILIGGVVQLALQWPFLKARSMPLLPDTKFSYGNPAVKKIFINMLPVLFSAAVVQVNTLMDSVIAWFMIPGDGAVTVLYMANRLMQFPLSIFGTSLSTVIFPVFSLYAVRGEKERFGNAVPEALRLCIFLGLPASLGLVILSKPIIFLIYQHNSFTSESAMRTTYVLLTYSCGLCFYILLGILSRAFYALGDTKTPTMVAFVIMLSNIVLNIIIVPFIQEIGLAMTTAFGALVHCICLLFLLQKKIPLSWQGTGIFLSKCILCNIIMSIAVTVSSCFFVYHETLKQRLMAVSIPILLGVLVYTGSAFLLKIKELERFGVIIRREKKIAADKL